MWRATVRCDLPKKLEKCLIGWAVGFAVTLDGEWLRIVVTVLDRRKGVNATPG